MTENNRGNSLQMYESMFGQLKLPKEIELLFSTMIQSFSEFGITAFEKTGEMGQLLLAVLNSALQYVDRDPVEMLGQVRQTITNRQAATDLLDLFGAPKPLHEGEIIDPSVVNVFAGLATNAINAIVDANSLVEKVKGGMMRFCQVLETLIALQLAAELSKLEQQIQQTEQNQVLIEGIPLQITPVVVAPVGEVKRSLDDQSDMLGVKRATVREKLVSFKDLVRGWKEQITVFAESLTSGTKLTLDPTKAL